MMKEQPKDLVKLTIPAKADYVGVVRLAVSGVATRMGFSYDDIEDLKLAVAEACTNVVDHAYSGQVGEISVYCDIFADRLQIRVLDHGASFDIVSAEKKAGPVSKNTPLESLRERGLGLYLMKSLMDRVEIEGDQGVLVTLTKYIRRDGVDWDVNTPKETHSY